jgi:molecular chaperone HscB
MNYFELFGLPIGFQLDRAKLRQSFMEVQKESHPDKFVGEGDFEQQNALERSALANKGFSILNNTDKLLPYVLEIKGILTPEEKYNLDPEFLMEMMDLNEAWMEADSQEQKEQIIHQINTIQSEIYAPIEKYMEMDQIDPLTQEELLQIKEYYFKKKYLQRILEEFHH